MVTVAMMRPGDKLESYRMLARSLTRCLALPWVLSVVGDGPASEAVREAFAAMPPDRLNWLGERPRDEIPAILAGADLFVWPGFGEAYGLAYLEAQAAGLPVVAQDVAGVPEVVRGGETGLLVPTGDPEAFAGAVTRLLEDAGTRRRMGRAARRFVLEERSLEGAARRIGELLARVKP
jgi:glycosyltransferase involved in cell wall biosynthesis